MPYLAEQTASGIAAGRPLMRPLCFGWPNDPKVWDHPSQYLLGDDLLVAPVTEPGAEEWYVYVPDGRWIDAWRGNEVVGPTTIEMPAPLDQIPVLIREPAAEQVLPLFNI